MSEDPWIEWSGGECPLPKGALHEVRLRNGMVRRDGDPEGWRWGHLDCDTDIIAYRICPDTASPSPSEVLEQAGRHDD
jgi:hypothetical protein